MQYATVRTIVGSLNYTMPATNMHAEPRIVRSTNALISNFRILGYPYEYATGIKTGSTPEAGYCLAASAQRGSRVLICVVLGAQRIKDADGVVVDACQFRDSRSRLELGLDRFDMSVLTAPAATRRLSPN